MIILRYLKIGKCVSDFEAWAETQDILDRHGAGQCVDRAYSNETMFNKICHCVAYGYLSYKDVEFWFGEGTAMRLTPTGAVIDPPDGFCSLNARLTAEIKRRQRQVYYANAIHVMEQELDKMVDEVFEDLQGDIR